jgi:hypothetical protein
MSRWHQMLKEIREPLDAVQNVQNVQKGDKDNGFERSEHSEHTAITEANGIPREWVEGYATLCTMPCPVAYKPQRWRQIVGDGGYFLDRWGRQAATLDWRALDVFGINPDAPDIRYDGMGLVPLLAGRRVCAVKQNAAGIDCGAGHYLTFYRRRTTSPCAITLWKLGKR